MRVRQLSPTGDYVFGHGNANFLVNSPEAVAQCIGTRLRLWTREWFLDITEGTPWNTDVLGTGTAGLYDQAIRARILGTPGVNAIVAYTSAKVGRALNVSATVNTIYGQASFSASLGR